MGSTFARFAQPEYIKTSLIRGWKVSCTAYNSDTGYVWQDIGNSTICLAFSGSLDSSAFRQTDNKFGVGNINERNDCFESMERALVYKEALTKFSDIWNDNLKAQVEKALKTGKSVLFTGHSIGGGIATLATLTSLRKLGKDAPVFAITYGFPLIGDEVLSREVRKQGWDNHFFNVVLRSDVFARTLLAPCESVCSPLEALLPYWQRSAKQMNEDDKDILMEPVEWGFAEYLSTVVQHAREVVEFITLTNMEAAKKLIASLKLAVELSPYRPFGYYLFCSAKGALLVENSETEVALPILYYSLASGQDQASISDHTHYVTVFNANTNIINLERRQILPLSQGAPYSAMEILLDFLEFGNGRIFHANTSIVNLEVLPIHPLQQGAPSSATEFQLAS
ncbi:hypothetical protein SUGI_0970180 [Cryptomeria japonica]|nr:hypothetical protein SUGI_0970180 [Cryptomeria japonica]